MEKTNSLLFGNGNNSLINAGVGGTKQPVVVSLRSMEIDTITNISMRNSRSISPPQKKKAKSLVSKFDSIGNGV